MDAKITRRTLVGGLSAVAAGGFSARPARAQGAQYVFKVGTDVPEAAPINVYLRKAIEAILKETGGRVELKLFPNNQLGGDPAMFSQLRSGALECFLLSGINVLSSMIPKASIYGLGFVFENDKTVYDALDGKLGQALRKQIQDAGFAVTDKIWANGFRQITSAEKPIKAVSDLQGFKIRVPVSPMWVSNFRALGASPTTIPFSEVYTALQTKVVDGQETPLTLISTAKLYEVQKYCALSDHMWDGWWCIFHGRAWNALPDDLKQIVSRNLDAAAVEQRVAVAQENEALKQELAKQGLIFNAVDRGQFREKLKTAGYYASWKKTFGDDLWSLLEGYVGPLT
ncbi:MAG: TRAP transporter substrate-binding protein [Parafilimonas terrae]|nr:TRAP transporter substrate-binding protein [Parafilimonas terrae]